MQLRSLPGNYSDLVVTGDDEGIFGVDAQFLYALKPLDREKQPSYSLQVPYHIMSCHTVARHDRLTGSSCEIHVLMFKNVWKMNHSLDCESLWRVCSLKIPTECVFVCTAGILQNIGAPTELHRRSVCHRQEWQCAHFHRGEHERQRAARASQRYKNLEVWWQRVAQPFAVWIMFIIPAQWRTKTRSVLHKQWKTCQNGSAGNGNLPLTSAWIGLMTCQLGQFHVDFTRNDFSANYHKA